VLHGILNPHTTADRLDSPSNSVVDDPAVIEIAKRLGKDPAGLLISWAIQRGSAAIPKSVTAARIESNFQGIYQPPQSSISLTDQHVSVRLHHP
jgi:L-glyceraldehyde reductase